MVRLGLFIGFFAVSISLLGFLSLFSRIYILAVSLLFLVLFIFAFRHSLVSVMNLRDVDLSKYEKILSTLLIAFALVAFWGVLTPEIAFDSLWYHLTIPKLYLERGEIYFIPGGLLYYSGFPKLVEMLYILPLSFWNETGAKLIQYFFGITSLVFLLVLSKKYVSRNYTLFAPAILTGNLVFAWESTVAFNDLGYLFYEILSFYCFTEFIDSRKRSWLMLLGLMIGFALLTKLIAVTSLTVYLLLLIYLQRNSNVRNLIKNSLIVIVFAALPTVPWLIFNYFSTGNAIYPFGSEYLNASSRLLSGKITSFVMNIVFANDPISPLYLIFIPFVVVVWKTLVQKQKILFLYTALTFLFWILISGTGGSRFLLPFLPIYSIGVVIIIEKMTERVGKSFYKSSFSLIALVLVVCILYRGVAQLGSIKYLIGYESKEDYLSRELNFLFGDFYDTDGFLKQNIKSNEKVLIYGAHNLYYADFNFIHQSWYRGEEVDYILTQNTNPPESYRNLKKVYSNSDTGTVLYKLN